MTAIAEEAENPNAEVAFTASPTAGLGVRAKGYRLVDLLFIIGALGLVWGAWELKAHAGDSEKRDAAIVQSIKEGNAAFVQALKEAGTQAKESNSATVKALQDVTTEQKKSTSAMREIACLSDPAMKNRPDAREFCRRMARDER